MKNLLIPALLLLFSCNAKESEKGELTEQQKTELKQSIEMHNVAAQKKFMSDSVQKAQHYRIGYVGLAEDTVEKYLKLQMVDYYKDWNKPYDIQKDRNLTLESYLEYCKTHNYLPAEYIKNLK